MRQEYLESAPLVDEDGDLVICGKWLADILPRTGHGDFMYLVAKHAGIALDVPKNTRWRIMRRLRDKGLMPERRKRG